MKFLTFVLGLFLLCPQLALAQTTRNPCYNTGTGVQPTGLPNCIGVGTATPLPVTNQPSGAAIQGNASGSTGAVVATLAAAVGRTTFLCDFDIFGIGGTSPLGPITVAGLLGGSKTYQLSSSATGAQLLKNFSPCIPASATNTAITITTTANGTATTVNVNSSGYQQ